MAEEERQEVRRQEKEEQEVDDQLPDVASSVSKYKKEKNIQLNLKYIPILIDYKDLNDSIPDEEQGKYTIWYQISTDFINKLPILA